MKIRQVAPSALKPYAKNPRHHSDAQVEHLCKLIREFGFRVPIVVDEKMVIVMGHGRWLAAQKLGLEKVPVHVVTGKTPEETAAMRLADNRVAEESTWDADLLAEELASLGDDFQLDLTGFDLADYAEPEAEPEEEPKLKELATDNLPDLAWVLISIPLVRFGEIAERVEQIAGIEGADVNTSVSNEETPQAEI